MKACTAAPSDIIDAHPDITRKVMEVIRPGVYDNAFITDESWVTDFSDFGCSWTKKDLKRFSVALGMIITEKTPISVIVKNLVNKSIS